MALEAQNNPFPSILMVEGDPETLPDADPAAGQRRLAVGTDHLLYLVNESGTKTLVGGDAAAHIADASDAHDASAISVLDTGALLTATDVEAALAEIATDVDTHIADTTAAHAASAIGFTPNGSIAATDVQAAIQEVRDEASAGSGSYVWLQRATISATQNTDITSFISATYETYEFVFQNILMTTDNVALLMQVGTGAGPTIDTGNNYNWVNWRSFSSSQGPNGGNAASSMTLFLGLDTTASTNWTLNGTLRLYNPSGAKYKILTGAFAAFDNGANAFLQTQFAGAYVSTTAMTAIRIASASSTVASGTIDVYGITHA